MAKKPVSMKKQRMISDIIVHAFLVIVSVIWLIPFVWIIAHSFRGESTGMYCSTFLPKEYTLDNYIGLLTDISTINFPRMFANTFIISIFACIISTFFVLAVAYCLSRVKWTMRKSYMNMAMVINLFPAFMSMVAIYFLLKAMGLTEGNRIPIALVICFTAGAGTGFTVMKGYMDTIPKALDEAALLDGCSRWQTFWKITLPLCKPLVVYQIATVSIGMWKMLEMEYIGGWFTRFCAAAVLVSIPIAILFMITQKFYQEAMGGAVKG